MKSFVNLTGDSLLGQLVKFQAPAVPASGTAAQPIVDAGTQVGTPIATMGFGAREQADETRQAQQREANDAVADVQMNDVVSREQAGTFTLTGKAFAAEANRLDTMAN